MKRFKNIVMIVVDDLLPESACYGREDLRTLNIDRLEDPEENRNIANDLCRRGKLPG
jgi:hypothetical protein